MNSLVYIIRFVWRIRYWLIFGPLLVALIVYFQQGLKPRQYTSSTTIYTGIVSGYDINTVEGARQDWNIINNAMDNLINIIMSQTTLHNVSLRLYAQDLVHGDPKRDNKYIMANHYNTLVERTPQEVLALVDKSSEEDTFNNLLDYETADHDNHVYGIFHWHHHHYSYEALRKIQIRRLSNSDMLEISYTNDDPGITYNTLKLLCDEFVKQYKFLRFGEINNVIAYFEGELARVGKELRSGEDSLTVYNVDNQVINYSEQTKHIAALERDFELRFQDVLLARDGSQEVITSIENKIEGLKTFKNNAIYIQKLDEISTLSSRIATQEIFQSDSLYNRNSDLDRLKQLRETQSESLANTIAQISSQQYTKEGLATQSIIQKWLDAVLLNEQSKAELKVLTQRKLELNKQYGHFSPIGSTLKRKERNIGFMEQSYLSILQALNQARLRQKGLQMSSATLKVINEPLLPLAAEPSKRKLLVIAAFFVSMIFILGFFILLEMLDHTLRNKIRAERITGSKVLGAFPLPPKFGARRYQKEYERIATQYLSNVVFNYLRPEGSNIINFLSTGEGVGKSLIAQMLVEHLSKRGLKVRYLSWNHDFDIDGKEFLMASKLSDFIHPQESKIALDQADVILVEYPPLSIRSIPYPLLHDAALNLMIARANHTWKDTDQLLYDKAVAQAGGAPLFLYLNNAEREVVENFTGQMPPYTFLRKLSYKFYQFGFTSVDN